MPELPNVVPGEPVEADWGNDIRDRSVQKYADQTALDASQPVPQLGELAWLNDPGWLVVCTDAVAPTWTPLLDLTDADGRWVLKAGDTMTGQLALTRLGVDALKWARSDSTVAEWLLGDNTAGQLYFRADGAPILGMYANQVQAEVPLIVKADQATIGAANARLILDRGTTTTWRLAVSGEPGNLLVQQSTDGGANWETVGAFNSGDGFSLNPGFRLQVLGDELTLEGSGTNKVRYTNAGAAVQVDRDAIWVSTGVPPNYRLDTITTLAASDPVVADFFADSTAAAALVGGHPGEGPTHRDIIQALVHEVADLRARVAALEA